jgi:hypothetical protein
MYIMDNILFSTKKEIINNFPIESTTPPRSTQRKATRADNFFFLTNLFSIFFWAVSFLSPLSSSEARCTVREGGAEARSSQTRGRKRPSARRVAVKAKEKKWLWRSHLGKRG